MKLVFDYDLYQVARERILNPGLTTMVANYINKLNTNIQIRDRGPLQGVSTTGSAPFIGGALGIPQNLIHGDRLSLLLGTLKLKNSFFALQESAVYISSHVHNKDSGIKLMHYFAYFATIAILDYHSGHFAKHEGNAECPFYHDVEAINLETMILKGQLCARCTSYIYQLEGEGRLDENLFTSVRAILATIANEYRKDKEIDLEEKIKINDEVNMKSEKQAEIESDTQIQKEKASTGRLGLNHDDDNPPDALGYQEYAEAFANAIASERTETPLTIGICAPWGRGKTVLLKYIKDKLEEYNTRSELKCQCIDFRAWEYSNSDQIWVEFYTKILREIEKRFKRWQKLKFRFYFYYKAFPVLSFTLTLSVILLIIATIFVNWSTVTKSIILLSAWSSVLIAFFTSTSKKIFFSINQIFSAKSIKARHEIVRRLEIISIWLTKHDNTRVVVFIDDIDRCHPNQVLQVFEAIKLFLDIKNFVFLTAMDTKVVRLAIAEHYRFMGSRKHEREEIGRYYLEKIIQVPFRLPELNKHQLLNLNSAIISKHLREQRIHVETIHIDRAEIEPAKSRRVKNNVADKNESKEKPSKIPGGISDHSQEDRNALIETKEADIIKDLLHIEEFDPSPRLLKRFINIYMVARHIYIQENQRKTGQDTAEVPPESFIKWLALSVLMPFETKALIEWWKMNLWEDPYGDGKLFLNGGFIYRDAVDDRGTVLPIPKKDSPFAYLKIESLDKMARIYSDMQIDHNLVRATLNITGCFNLVLD